MDVHVAVLNSQWFTVVRLCVPKIGNSGFYEYHWDSSECSFQFSKLNFFFQ